MTPRHLPPVSGRFIKGRSGNPLGRPKVIEDKELILLAIKFFDTFAKVYFRQGDSNGRLERIKQILYEKKVLPTKKF
ncbi:MAG: hypothetical protein IKP06_04705 [Elusimicrobiaceae bacterium]|nr:hypothetical protein [Elusimicrobiaceae bacterium]